MLDTLDNLATRLLDMTERANFRALDRIAKQRATRSSRLHYLLDVGLFATFLATGAVIAFAPQLAFWFIMGCSAMWAVRVVVAATQRFGPRPRPANDHGFVHLLGVFWFVILLLVVLGLVLFGIISLAASMYVALGVGLMVVGVAQLFTKGTTPTIALGIVGFGLMLTMFSDYLPGLTVGGALSFLGVGGG